MHLRNDWTRAEIQALYQQPFLDLVFQAQQIHRQYFEANAIQVSTLLSIKTAQNIGKEKGLFWQWYKVRHQYSQSCIKLCIFR
jgi:biotin synthase-like enzyme